MYNNSKWLNWIITDEQAEHIRNGDKIAFDKFFNDNIENIKSVICSLFKNKSYLFKGYHIEDLLSQSYLDLIYCNFKSGGSIIKFLKLSLGYYSMGGYYYLKNENGKAMTTDYIEMYKPSNLISLDLFKDNLFADEKALQIEEFNYNKNIKYYLCVIGQYLHYEKQYLAFGYWLEGYSFIRISELLNSFSSSASRSVARVCEIIKKNKKTIIEKLKNNTVYQDCPNRPWYEIYEYIYSKRDLSPCTRKRLNQYERIRTYERMKYQQRKALLKAASV